MIEPAMPNTAKKRSSAKRSATKRGALGKSGSKSAPIKKKATPKRRAAARKSPAKQPVIDSEYLVEQIDLLRPALRAHGGDIELVRVEAGRVIVRLTGACAGCPMAQVTLKQGVEKFLVKRVKGVTGVEAVPPDSK
jgi:Fe-S cluster biogenesis protein NfuA